jgi:threonine dehydratase
MGALSFEPTFKDVVKAYRFLSTRVRHTPTEYSYALSERVQAPVYIKWENRQICGAFKIRGAFYKMSVLSEEERARGVVTCSSGNHGQGVALAAQEMKVKATIFVPLACPDTKRQAIRRLGGDWVELIVADGDFDFAEQEALRFAKETGGTHISSFEDACVIAGQGTAGLEMFMDEPDIEYLIVPAGGGGLLNGIAISAKAINPDVEIFGVQSVASNPWVVSWEGGVVKAVEYSDTLADGLAGAIPQSLLTLAKSASPASTRSRRTIFGAPSLSCTRNTARLSRAPGQWAWPPCWPAKRSRTAERRASSSLEATSTTSASRRFSPSIKKTSIEAAERKGPGVRRVPFSLSLRIFILS